MTITEIARLAGVSVSTVSKIVNHKDASISSETRERVLSIVKEHNYRPYATRTAGGRTGTIGVLVREHSGSMLQGIISAANRQGYTVSIRLCEDATSLEQGLACLLSLHVDGLVIDSSIDSAAIADRAHGDTPCVLTDDPASPASPHIDYELLGFQATCALVERGHTAIACLAGPGSRTEGFVRGYRDALLDRGITFSNELLFSATDELPTAAFASHAFSGIVVSHFRDALRLYQIAEQLHYEIPYDLSVVSLKGTEEELVHPRVSTLEIPRRALGEALVDHLVSSIESTPLPAPFITEGTLDTSASIDIPFRSRAKRIIAVGSINVDTYLAFDQLPSAGAAAITPSSDTFPGGKCLNEAIGVQKLGHDVVAIGRVGNDADADYLFTALLESRVDTAGVKRTAGRTTGQAFVFVPRDGDSMISIVSGANEALTAADVRAQERLFTSGDFCLINTEIPLEAVREALVLARNNHVSTVLKPSAAKLIPPSMLALVDYLIPNQEELETLCPEQSDEASRARFLLSAGVGCVVVTLGSRGCLVCTSESAVEIPAMDVVAVDTTGAGDAFIAAFATYRAEGFSIEASARIANCAAGFSTTRQGASSALIDRTSLEAHLRNTAPELLTR